MNKLTICLAAGLGLAAATTLHATGRARCRRHLRRYLEGAGEQFDLPAPGRGAGQ